jgi:phosphoribosyl-ATP pyrophosphohydrolase
MCTANRATDKRLKLEDAVVESALVLHKLMAVIEDRKRNPPEKSYTSTLLAGGVVRIGKKILEESRELVEAAGETGDDGRQHMIREAADVLYHLLVLLAQRDASLSDVEEELARRFGISGIDEKASRTNP